MNPSPVTVESKIEEKHMELHRSITRLHNDLINRLVEVEIRIREGVAPPKAVTSKAEDDSPSLNIVLTEAPSFVRGTLDEALNAIDRIEELLF